jgi:hypothetical protein
MSTNPSPYFAGRLFPLESEFTEIREERGPATLEATPPLQATRLARQAAEERVAEAAAIQADPNLSAEGKAERLKATHAAAAEKLGRPQRYLERLEGEIESLKASIRPKALDPSDSVAAIGGQEFRTYLRGLDGPTRIAAVQRAIMQEDVESLAKVCGGPAELSGIAPQTWSQAREALIRAQHPDRIERVENLERNADALRRAVRAATSIVNEIGGQEFDRSTLIGA